MIIIGIDPGPTHCGVVVYETEAKRVLWSHKACEMGEVLWYLMCGAFGKDITLDEGDRVAIERVQSYGIAGASLLRTAEVGGRLYQQATWKGLQPTWLYRREILRALDVTGKGNRDSLVRERLIEMHGGDAKTAKGTKKNPGPLFGVSSHAWAALAVAVVAAMEVEND